MSGAPQWPTAPQVALTPWLNEVLDPSPPPRRPHEKIVSSSARAGLNTQASTVRLALPVMNPGAAGPVKKSEVPLKVTPWTPFTVSTRGVPPALKSPGRAPELGHKASGPSSSAEASRTTSGWVMFGMLEARFGLDPWITSCPSG